MTYLFVKNFYGVVLGVMLSVLIGGYHVTARMFNYEKVIGWTGFYNLSAYGLLLLTIVLLLSDLNNLNNKKDYILGYFLGGIWLILSFIKISFGAVALVMIFFHLFYRSVLHQKTFKRYFWTIFKTSLVVGIVFFFYFEGQILNIIRDFQIVSDGRFEAQALAKKNWIKLFHKFENNIFYTSLIVAFACLYITRGVGWGIRRGYYFAFQYSFFLLILFLDFFIAISITQPPELPILEIAPFFYTSVMLYQAFLINARKGGYSGLHLKPFIKIFIVPVIFFFH